VSDAAQLRADIAAAVVTAMPGWGVYPAPPDIVAAPAVVIAPRSPYRERVEYGREAVRLQLTILVPRAAGPAGMEVLDTACDDVIAAVESVAEATWEQVESVGPVQEQGGIEYLTATLNVVGYVGC